MLKLLVTLVMMFMVSSMAMAVDDYPANPLEKSGWTLIKNDEFNGSSLDTNLWEPYYLRHRTTDTRAACQYVFRNGAIVIQIPSDKPTYLSDAEWKCSSIQTGEKTNLHKDGVRSVPTFEGFLPKYGYYEVRAKHQAGSGHHVAFWFIGFEDQSSNTGEIDVSEDPGSGLTYTKLGNVVEWSDPNMWRDSGDSFNCGVDLTQGFHIYAVHWEQDRVRFYFDNVLKKTVNCGPNYRCAFFLGLYEKCDWTLPFDSSIPYPKEYAVDYFRAYQEGGSSTPTPTPGPGSSINVEAESATGISPFEVQSDGSASGGQYIVWPNNGSNQILSSPSDSATGQAAYTFTLSQTANVNIDVRVDFANGNDDSFYYKMDSGSWNTQNNTQTSGWSTLDIATYNSLSSGSHTFKIERREDGSKIDMITLTASSGTISSSGGSTPTPPPTATPSPTPTPPPGGTVTLYFRYALGNSDRTGSLIVNGNSQNITFAGTGEWNNWSTKNVNVTLNGGTTNTIRLESTGQDLANIDQLSVSVGGTYQAEDASYGGGCTLENNHSGYYGTGFINFPSSGGYVQFNNVNGG